MRNPSRTSPFLLKLTSIARVRPNTAHSIALTYFWAQKNAKQRKIEFLLSQDDVVELARRSRGCCEISGIRFSSEGALNPYDRRPWAPSFDRLDRSKGYMLENCRLVCVAANIAMNTWGEDVLRTLALAIISPPSKATSRQRRAVPRETSIA